MAWMAFDCPISTQVSITVTCGATDTYTGPASGNALTLAQDFLDWLNHPSRGFTFGFSLAWFEYLSGRAAIIYTSGLFDLTVNSGTNSLHLPDVTFSSESTGTLPADGTWSPKQTRLPPLWAKVGAASMSRTLTLGAPLRVDASHGSTCKAASLQAFADARDMVRLSALFEQLDGLTTALTFTNNAGTQTQLRWESYEATRQDDIYTVTMPIWQEV